MQLPIGSEGNFRGVVDLLTMKAVYWEDEYGKEMRFADVPEELQAQAEEMRARLVERSLRLDDDLTVKFLEGEEISVG